MNVPLITKENIILIKNTKHNFRLGENTVLPNYKQKSTYMLLRYICIDTILNYKPY